MKYQGGKGRIARRLVETIVRLTPETSTRWVEPFVGGAWVLEAAHKVGRFQAAEIRHADYRAWDETIDERTVVYCDPPYAETRGYRGGDSSRSHGAGSEFDSVAFWAWCNRMAVERGAHVFVSEYSGPEWATEVWARTARQTVSAGAWNYSVTDRLFHLDPATTPADAEPFIIPSAPHVSNAPSIDGPAPTDQEVTE